MSRLSFTHLGFLLRDRQTPAGRATNAVLYILNTAFILLYILSTYDLPAPTLSAIRGLELALGVVFLGEYVVRVQSADSWRAEITNPYTIIDLVAVLPIFVFPGLGAEFLRGFSTLRIFRFLRLLVNEQQFLGKSIRVQTVRRLELSVTIFLIFFIATGFVYAAEAAANSSISNFGDAFYYTVIAVSTVGFGDIIPTTAAGRWVTVAAVLIGFVLIPWQATRLREASTAVTVACPRCGAEISDDDRYCRQCGERLVDEHSN